MINIAYLSLGCNVADVWSNLQSARSTINNRVGRIQKHSAVYETQPWGKTDQPNYLNQMLCISTPLTAEKLLIETQKIEQSLGRQRLEKWGARTIDIDILFFGTEIITLPNLQIPHPLLHERNFILVPLLEIAPLFKHPILKKTIKELALSCPDTLVVKKCGTNK